MASRLHRCRSTITNLPPIEPMPIDPRAETAAIEKADPSGWAGRLRAILGCSRLVSALVLLLMLLSAVCGYGASRLIGAEDLAQKAKAAADRANMRADMQDQQLMLIDRTVQRIEAKLDRLDSKILSQPTR